VQRGRRQEADGRRQTAEVGRQKEEAERKEGSVDQSRGRGEELKKTNMKTSDQKREMLRHTVATLAYRGAKAVRGAPDSFASFKASETTRTPAQILAHVGDLLDWALSIARGEETWHNAKPLPWPKEIQRFHKALGAFDKYLASDAKLAAATERLFQGPVADALTHVGQIAMLRRIAGEPVKGENYSRAKIKAGRVSSKQQKPAREFD